MANMNIFDNMGLQYLVNIENFKFNVVSSKFTEFSNFLNLLNKETMERISVSLTDCLYV